MQQGQPPLLLHGRELKTHTALYPVTAAQTGVVSPPGELITRNSYPPNGAKSSDHPVCSYLEVVPL